MPISRVFCSRCSFSLPQGIDGQSYAVGDDGKRVLTGMHPDESRVQEITGMDYWTAYGCGRAGFLSHGLCLDCLEPSDLDLERDEKRCPRCGSLRVFSRRGLPGEKCPQCDDGELRYEIPAVT